MIPPPPLVCVFCHHDGDYGITKPSRHYVAHLALEHKIKYDLDHVLRRTIQVHRARFLIHGDDDPNVASSFQLFGDSGDEDKVVTTDTVDIKNEPICDDLSEFILADPVQGDQEESLENDQDQCDPLTITSEPSSVKIKTEPSVEKEVTVDPCVKVTADPCVKVKADPCEKVKADPSVKVELETKLPNKNGSKKRRKKGQKEEKEDKKPLNSDDESEDDGNQCQNHINCKKHCQSNKVVVGGDDDDSSDSDVKIVEINGKKKKKRKRKKKTVPKQTKRSKMQMCKRAIEQEALAKCAEDSVGQYFDESKFPFIYDFNPSQYNFVLGHEEEAKKEAKKVEESEEEDSERDDDDCYEVMVVQSDADIVKPYIDIFHRQPAVVLHNVDEYSDSTSTSTTSPNFNCGKCMKIMANKNNCTRPHLYRNYDHVADELDKPSSTEIKLYEPKWKNYSAQCKVCSKWFPRLNMAREHLKTHEEVTKKINFTTDTDLEKVQNWVDRFAYKCSICKAFFSTTPRLFEHVQDSHQLGQAEYLGQCGNVVKSSTVKLYCCVMCNKKIIHNRNGIEFHTRMQHGLTVTGYFDRNYLHCDEHKCGKFLNCDKIKCQVCCTEFLTRQCFDNHLKKHDMSPQDYLAKYDMYWTTFLQFQCRVCYSNFRYYSEQQFDIHLYKHDLSIMQYQMEYVNGSQSFLSKFTTPVYDCQLCNSVVTDENFDHHLVSRHNCDVQDYLNTHGNPVGDKNLFVCIICCEKEILPTATRYQGIERHVVQKHLIGINDYFRLYIRNPNVPNRVNSMATYTVHRKLRGRGKSSPNTKSKSKPQSTNISTRCSTNATTSK